MALHGSGITPAVMEKDSLLTVRERIVYLFNQHWREQSLHVFAASQVCGIYNIYQWEPNVAEPLLQGYQSILSAYGIGVTLNRWGGASKQCLGTAY